MEQRVYRAEAMILGPEVDGGHMQSSGHSIAGARCDEPLLAAVKPGHAAARRTPCEMT